MNIEKIYKKYLKKGDKIVIACSGGADSTYLLYKSLELSKKMDFKIVAAHLNHKLRGKEADEDENFVKKLCEKLNIKCITKSQNFKSFSEDKGRKARQKFFEEVRKKEKAKFIVLAQHQDDQTETILMNFVRGSGLTGLQGMNELSGKFLRPLLNIQKAEILKFLKKNKLKYREDKTNKDNSYTRNFYRNLIIPEIKEKNPNLNESLTKSAKNFKEIEEFINKKARNWIKNHQRNRKYDLKSFRKQDPAIQKEVLRELYKKTKGDLQNLESKHIEEVLDLLMNSHSGKYKNLGKHTSIRIVAKKFEIVAL